MKDNSTSAIPNTAASISVDSSSIYSNGGQTFSNLVLVDNNQFPYEKISNTSTGKSIFDELAEIREMLLMINRDMYLEKKYPKLKEIADEYHRNLEKYKTFERLKGE